MKKGKSGKSEKGENSGKRWKNSSLTFFTSSIQVKTLIYQMRFYGVPEELMFTEADLLGKENIPKAGDQRPVLKTL